MQNLGPNSLCHISDANLQDFWSGGWPCLSSPLGSKADSVFPRIPWVTWTGHPFRGHWDVCSLESVMQLMLSWAHSPASLLLSKSLLLPGHSKRHPEGSAAPTGEVRGLSQPKEGVWDCEDPRPHLFPRDLHLSRSLSENHPNPDA